MSNDKCDIVKTVKGIEKELDDSLGRELDEAVEKISPTDENENGVIEAMEKLLEKKGSVLGDVIEQNSLREAYKDLYGKVDERQLTAIAIKAILRASPGSQIIARDFLKSKGFIAPKNPDGTKKFKRLRDYPLSSLNNLLYTLIGFSQAGDTRGVFGKKGFVINFGRKFKQSLFTPKELGKLEHTGALYLWQDAMTTYYEKVQRRQNRFSKGYSYTDEEWQRMKGKVKRKEGMNVVMEEVINLVHDYLVEDIVINKRGYVDNETQIMELFTQLMHGWAKPVMGKDGKTPTGEFTLAQNWLPMKDENGKTKFWADGDVMFDFQDYTDIKNAFDGQYYLPLPDKTKVIITKKLLKLVDRARAIDKKVFEYTKKEFDKTMKNLTKGLERIFPGLSKKHLEALIYDEEGMFYDQAFKQLNSNQKAILKVLKDTVSGLSSMKHFQYATQNREEKTNHYPIVYDKQKFRWLWDSFIQDMEKELGKVREGLSEFYNTKTKEVVPGKDINDYEFKTRGKFYQGLKAVKMAERQIKDLTSSLIRAMSIRDNQDGYRIDPESNQPIVKVGDQKHMKRITNAFNPMHARMTPGVYNDYLRNNMSSIERNNLAATFLDAIAMLQRKDGSFNKDVLEYMRNYYTVPFNNPHTYGTLGPWKYSPKTSWTSKAFQKLFRVDAEKVMDWSQKLSKFNTFRWLGGWRSPVTNMFAVQKHIAIGGLRAFLQANNIYGSEGTEKNAWDRLISESGVIDFNDFFSESMINDVAGTEIENKVSQEILSHMLKYYKDKNKKNIKTDSKADLALRKKMEEKIHKSVKESRAINNYVSVMLSENRAKKRFNEVKSSRWRDIGSKLANAAINKEYVISKYIKDTPWAETKAWGENLYSGWLRFWSLGGKLTMGGTEQRIRSIAFIMGVRHAQEIGVIPKKPVNEFTPQEEEFAIDYGKHYSKLFNYGLSTTDVGQFNWGAFGNQMGKFTYWAQQNMGTDHRIMTEGIRGVKSFEQIVNSQKGTTMYSNAKAFLKLLRVAFGLNRLMIPTKGLNYHKNLRSVNPEAAIVRNSLLMAVPTTVAVDFLFMGPFALGWRTLGLLGMGIGAAGGKSIRSASSDYISLATSAFVTIPLFFLAGGYDDEEDVERHVTHYMRRSFFGWLPNFAFDQVMGLIAMGYDDDAMYKRTDSAIRNFIPFTPIRFPIHLWIDSLKD